MYLTYEACYCSGGWTRRPTRRAKRCVAEARRLANMSRICGGVATISCAGLVTIKYSLGIDMVECVSSDSGSVVELRGA